MKTSVNMIRKMGTLEVTQRTKDSMFNATGLLREWNKRTGMKKEVSKFFALEQTNIFIKTLQDKELNHTQEIAYHKSKANKGINAGTWMHPFLFIKFAMWINPEFELEVIKFVYDQLIEFRHSAGDMYKGLTNSLTKFKDTNFSQVAKGLNWIIFDKHESGIRQKASQQELKELADLEKKLAFAIDMGYIKSYGQLINEMRKIYHQRKAKF